MWCPWEVKGEKGNRRAGGLDLQWSGWSLAKAMRPDLGRDGKVAAETELRDVSEEVI